MIIDKLAFPIRTKRKCPNELLITSNHSDILMWILEKWTDETDHQYMRERLPNVYQVFGHTQQESELVITEQYACLDCRRAFLLTSKGNIIEAWSNRFVPTKEINRGISLLAQKNLREFLNSWSNCLSFNTRGKSIKNTLLRKIFQYNSL